MRPMQEKKTITMKSNCSLFVMFYTSCVQAAINAMRKEVLESGHVRDRGGRRDVQEGADLEGSSLSTFMHAAARDRLLPLLSTNCKTTHEQARVGQARNVVSS